MHVDIALVGAGPAGFCFARTLARTGLSILLIEQQSLDTLREPPVAPCGVPSPMR